MPLSLVTEDIELVETERPASGFYWSTISSWEEVGLRSFRIPTELFS